MIPLQRSSFGVRCKVFKILKMILFDVLFLTLIYNLPKELENNLTKMQSEFFYHQKNI